MQYRAALTTAALCLTVLQGCTGADAGVRSTQPRLDAGLGEGDAGPEDAQDASWSSQDSGLDVDIDDPARDAAMPDAGEDAPSDTGEVSDPGCGEAAALDVLGDYWHGLSAEHWLRKNERAVTYSIVPSGPAEASSPPRLYRVVRACNDGQFFVALDATQGVVRVDWEPSADGSSLRVCELHEAFGDVEAATKAKAPSRTSDTACSGKTWRSLVRQSL